MDSMVLLDLARRAGQVLGLSIGVIHVDHGLRGMESEEDARFVEERCRLLSLPFHLARLCMEPLAANLEEEARERRYHAVRECRELGGYASAATGHTLDDQAETIIYRIVRGTGIRGLSGMDYRRHDGIIRPMLGMTRMQVADYAARHGLDFVHDASNDHTRHARNLIRSSIMPVMRQINPRVAHAVASLAVIARQEGDVLEKMADDLGRDAMVFDWSIIRAFGLRELGCAAEAVLRRLVIGTIASMTGEQRGMDAEQVDRVMRVVSGEAAAHAVRRKVRVCRDGNLLVFHRMGRRPHYVLTIDRSGDVSIPGIRQNVHIILPGGYSGRLVLRSWLPGDRMEGRRVSETLSAMRVPGCLRPFWPVLASDGGVVAVASEGPAAGAYSLVMGADHGR
jgi:tRNA(Ile)-lysidine synthase